MFSACCHAVRTATNKLLCNVSAAATARNSARSWDVIQILIATCHFVSYYTTTLSAVTTLTILATTQNTNTIIRIAILGRGSNPRQSYDTCGEQRGMGQDFLHVLRFPPSVSFHQRSILMYHRQYMIAVTDYNAFKFPIPRDKN